MKGWETPQRDCSIIKKLLERFRINAFLKINLQISRGFNLELAQEVLPRQIPSIKYGFYMCLQNRRRFYSCIITLGIKTLNDFKVVLVI
jgi:hypothetical protein